MAWKAGNSSYYSWKDKRWTRLSCSLLGQKTPKQPSKSFYLIIDLQPCTSTVISYLPVLSVHIKPSSIWSLSLHQPDRQIQDDAECVPVTALTQGNLLRGNSMGCAALPINPEQILAPSTPEFHPLPPHHHHLLLSRFTCRGCVLK